MRALNLIRAAVVLTISFVGGWSGAVQAGALFEEGFRSVKWEAQCSQIAGFKELGPDSANDVSKIYVRAGEVMSVGGVSVDRVVYDCRSDRLVAVSLVSGRRDDATAMQSALTKELGMPKRQPKDPRTDPSLTLVWGECSTAAYPYLQWQPGCPSVRVRLNFLATQFKACLLAELSPCWEVSIFNHEAWARSEQLLREGAEHKKSSQGG